MSMRKFQAPFFFLVCLGLVMESSLSWASDMPCDLSQFVNEHVELRSRVKGLVYSSSLVNKQQALQNIERGNFFEEADGLIGEIFHEKAWHPSHHIFKSHVLKTLFQDYVRQDISAGEVLLANFYYSIGMQVSDKSLKELCLEKAASIGHPEAQYDMFLSSFKNRKSQEAKNYLFSSASQGNSKALYTLSNVHEGYWEIGIKKDLLIAKELCKEASDMNYPDAEFSLNVATYTEGAFGSDKNFQQGVRNAKLLAEKGNERANKFLNSIQRSSLESLTEVRDDLTDEDLDFLVRFLDWRGMQDGSD